MTRSRIILVAIGLLLIAGISTCVLRSNARDRAFDQLRLGDSEEHTIALFGVAPSVRERPEKLFGRYASTPCSGGCAERIWFENRLSLDTEAWSVEFDRSGHVIRKNRWSSP